MREIAEIGAAMCAALNEGKVVVSIATVAHRQLLETELATRGVDVVEAWGTGRYIFLDVLEMFSTVMIAGSPDVVHFAEAIGAPLDRAAEQHGCVMIFGDLVPPMHAACQPTGAIELENLLRSFLASRPMFIDPPQRGY